MVSAALWTELDSLGTGLRWAALPQGGHIRRGGLLVSSHPGRAGRLVCVRAVGDTGLQAGAALQFGWRSLAHAVGAPRCRRRGVFAGLDPRACRCRRMALPRAPLRKTSP